MAKELKDCGISFRTFLLMKPSLDIYWTPEIVKRVFKEVQHAMYGTESTTELTTKQVTEVYDAVNKMFGEICGVSLAFPSMEELFNNYEE